MNITIEPHLVRQSIENQNKEIQSIIDQLRPFKHAIQNYLAARSLAGLAYSKNKEYFSQGHFPMIDELANGLRAMSEANRRHLSAANNLEHCYYSQGSIDREIHQLEFTIRIESAVNIFGLFTESLRMANNRLNTLRGKRARLERYITAITGIYEGIPEIFTNVNRLLLRLEHVSVCPDTGGFVLPTPEKLDEIMTIQEIVDGLFDEDGVFNAKAASDLFNQVLESESELHYRALLALHLDSRLSYQDIVDIYTAQSRFAGSMQDVFATRRQALVQKLAADVNTHFMAQFDIARTFNWPFSEEAQLALETHLRRAQLITFIGEVSELQWQSFDRYLDLSNFEREKNPEIIFLTPRMGQMETYAVSQLPGLATGNFSSDLIGTLGNIIGGMAKAD